MEVVNKNGDVYTPRCSAVEKERRLRSIYQWLVDGQSTKDILTNIIKAWKVNERQAKKYLSEARAMMREAAASEYQDSFALYKASQLESYRILVFERSELLKDTAISREDKIKALTALNKEITSILNHVAKVEGVMIDRLDHTSKGEKLGEGTGVFELLITTDGVNFEEKTEELDEETETIEVEIYE